MAYKIEGGVPVIGTLTQSVDSDFPIVIADSIQLTDGTVINQLLMDLREAVFGGGGGVPMSEIDDSIISLESTWSSRKISNVISDLKDEIPTFDSVYTKDEVYNKNETDQKISDMISDVMGEYVTQSQLTLSLDNAILNAVGTSKRYTEDKFAELDSRVTSLETLVGAGFEPIEEEWILSFFQDEP